MKMTTSKLIFCTFFLLPLLLAQATETPLDYILCAHYEGTIEHLPEDEADGADLFETTALEQPYRKCYGSYCYTLWQEDGDNHSVIMGQGKNNFLYVVNLS